MGIRKSKIYIKISHFVEKCGNFFMKHRIVLNIPGVSFVGEKVQKKKTKLNYIGLFLSLYVIICLF